MPVRALQRQLNSVEFAEYMALDKIIGWSGHQRNKKRAIGLAMFHNVHADRKLQPADYEAHFYDPPVEDEPASKEEQMRQAMKARGVQFIDKREGR